MKTRTLIILVAALSVSMVRAQNTFPESGNVGIGTWSPNAQLDVSGEVRISGVYTWDNVFSSLDIGNGLHHLVGTYRGWNPTAVYIAGYNARNNSGYATTAVSVGGSGSERLWVDLMNGNVGIGTTSPGSKVEVSTVDPVIRIRNTNDAAGGFIGDTWGVTQIGRYNPSSVRYGTIDPGQMRSVLGIDADGRVGTLLNNFGDVAWRNLLDDGQGNSYIVGNVGIGTTSPTAKLSVNGAIRARAVIVDTNWADYVFAKEYRLAPLTEVARHIESEGRLPGVPSAKEVAENGVSIGEIQSILLSKIEELTLHQIAQEKRLDAQQAKIDALRAENAELKANR